MLRERLRQWNIPTVSISSGDFEAANAGDPAKLMRAKLRKASEYITKESYLGAAVVIDDLDASLGTFGENVASTTNRQQLIGDLMHYCDDPWQIGDTSAARVPVFATANDATKLYGPLRRSGRMEVVTWHPDAAELAAIAAAMFPGLSLADAQRLVATQPELTPAILGEVAGALENARFNHSIRNITHPSQLQHLLANVVNGQVVANDRQAARLREVHAALTSVMAMRRTQADFSALPI